MSAVSRTGNRRILALWFPYLPSDRVFRRRLGRSWRSAPARDRPPLAFSRSEGNTRRLAALSEPAERLRLKRGMGVADARAIHPALEVVEADPDTDLRLLESLADWCDRYTPLVALDGADGLLLDITGCAHLFGGESRLLADVVARLGRQGFCVRAGLASTPGAAWASARFLDGRVIPCGEEEDFLAALPLHALRLGAEVRTGLEGVGLRTIGAILSTPRAPLARRFGGTVLLRLDQALGRIEEPISPRFPAPPLSVERQFAEPVLLVEEIEAMTGILAASIGRELERRQEGARGLRLTLFRVDGAVRRIDLQTSRPLRDAVLVRRLFRERLLVLENDIDAGCGFELIRLSVLAADRFDARQGDLAGDGREEREDIALLADRVAARLGAEAVMRPVLVESHVPERAVRMMPFAVAAGAGGMPPAASTPRERPIRLFARPEPVDVSAVEVPEGPPPQFRWRRQLHVVARAEGPERIAPEWWQSGTEEPTRDYFRVEITDGRRYWLYREGLYDVSQAMPRWFMHGIFA